MISKLQYITVEHPVLSPLEQVKHVVAGGCDWIQLRLKSASNEDFYFIAEAVKEFCEEQQVKLIINDHVEIAKAINADGIHIGKNDMAPEEARAIIGPDMILGCTANTYDDVKAIHKTSADYIGLGPLRYTDTKKRLSPVLGLEGYQRILSRCDKEEMKLPIVGIGNVQVDDIYGLLGMGLHGVAVASGIAAEENVAYATSLYMEKIKSFKRINHYFNGVVEGS